MTDDITPGPPPPPPAPDVLASLDVDAPALVRAIVVGALSYAAAWLTSLVLAVLLVVLALVQDEGGDVSWWWLLTGPGQGVAAAFGSPVVFSLTSSGEGLAGLDSTSSSTAVLLSLLAVTLTAVSRLSRRDEASAQSGSTKAAVTLAMVTGVTFVMLALLVALVLKVSLDEDGDAVRLSAGSFQLVLFGLMAVGTVALFGRRPWTSWRILTSIPLAARGAWRGVLVHLTVFSVLAVPTGIIWIIVEGEGAALLALPAVVGNLLVWALTIGHLGALSISGFGALLDEADFGSTTFWAFSDDSEMIVWILIPFAIVGALASAVVLHERGNGRSRTTGHWVWSAVVYAGVGAAVTLLGTVSTGFGSSYGAGGSVSFGPAPWFIVVFAAWGALAELLARLLGPSLSAMLPAAWVRRAVGRVGPVHISGAASPDTSAPAPLAPASASVAPSAPLEPGTKRLLIGIGSAVVLLVVTVIGVSIVNKMFFGPEGQVEDYFAALADGDAEKAVGLAQLDYSTRERVLLTDKIFGESGGTIADIDVGSVQRQGDYATASVTYTIDGADQSQDVTLRRSGSHLLFFDKWELVNPGLGTLYVSAPGATGLKVNGRTVDVEGLDEGVELPVFPGEYDVTPVADSRYVTFESESASIGTDSESLDFELAPSDKLLAEVATQADAYLADCIAQPEADPEGCPNETYGYQLEDVVWTLAESPSYELDTDYDGGWRLSTSNAGSATVTAKEPSFFDDEPARDYTDTVTIELTGTVTVEGDTVTVEVDSY